MTPEQQRLAIASKCGWELRQKLFHNGQWKEVSTWVQSKFYKGKPLNYCMAGQLIGAFPPDYPNDLNAMHEAEKVFLTSKDADMVDYCGKIQSVVGVETYWGVSAFQASVVATAEQRAEAFCRTFWPEKF